MREGNLEAPTRHPLDWKNSAFHDPQACLQEMQRVFDICQGCRRCVSLCQGFPTLFDLVDATADGEVHSVAPADLGQVVDQCYLCDLCHATKCPYTAPHPWQLDVPQLMLRAKAIRHSQGLVGEGAKMLARTDVHGSLAGIPVVVQAVNAAQRSPAGRGLLDSLLGVHPQAWLPPLAPRRLRQSLPAQGRATEVHGGQRTPGKVAVFATCFVHHHEPAIGRDLARVLDHNAIPWVLATPDRCCGMPQLELGDLPAVERHKQANIPVLARLAGEGYAILSPMPSCTLMFKQQLPLMFPDDADVLAVQAAMFDPFEYLLARHKDGLLKTDFQRPLGQVSYHVPCHGRVQNIGRKTEEMFRLVGKTVAVQLTTVERCSGHAGLYGVRTATHPVALKIGKPVFKAMAKDAPDVICSDCALAGHHIAQGMQQAGTPAPALQHPLSLLRHAYGLD